MPENNILQPPVGADLSALGGYSESSGHLYGPMMDINKLIW
jgi:hypothetical protein